MGLIGLSYCEGRPWVFKRGNQFQKLSVEEKSNLRGTGGDTNDSNL